MEEMNLVDLCNKIRSADATTREEGWKMLNKPEAVAPLADAMSNPDKPTAKAAKELLASLAHRAARPGAAPEAKAVTKELLRVAQSNRPTLVRAFALHLTGFTADGTAAPALAKLLAAPDVQEEARMALERIPGAAPTAALKGALKTVPAAFRPNIEQSLHNRALTPKTVGELTLAK